MSSSLVRKSLELVESELDNRAQPLKQTRKNELLKNLKVRKKKYQSQTKRVLGDVRSEAALQVELARRISSVKQDRTSENLKNLVLLSSSNSVDFKKAHKIFEQTVRKSRITDETAPESSSSVFTEEDFRKFEEEYFVN